MRHFFEYHSLLILVHINTLRLLKHAENIYLALIPIKLVDFYMHPQTRALFKNKKQTNKSKCLCELDI